MFEEVEKSGELEEYLKESAELEETTELEGSEKSITIAIRAG